MSLGRYVLMNFGIRVACPPRNALLQTWADRELAENLDWLRAEFRLQAREQAAASDDGMRA